MPFGKIRVEKCQDGRRIRVYKDPGEAFRVTFTDWDSRVSAGVNAVQGINANAGAQVATRTKALLGGLDSANRSMQMKFNALYIRFSSNACAMETWWTQKLEEVLREEKELRFTLLRIEDLKGSTENEKIDSINEILYTLQARQKSTEPSEPIRGNPNNIERWRRPSP